MELSPTIFTLEDDHIRSILARNNVGRIAFVQNGEVEIRPIHYAYHDGSIYGRTGPNAVLFDAVTPGAPVAFEVDEIDTVFRWKSVIVKGEMRPLARDSQHATEWREAATLLSRVVRKALIDGDPLPDKSVIFRISVRQMTGRASIPSLAMPAATF